MPSISSCCDPCSSTIATVVGATTLLSGSGSPEGLIAGTSTGLIYTDLASGTFYVFNGTLGSKVGWSPLTTINPRVLGARGDNSHDDTAALQAAIDIATINQSTGNRLGYIFLPNGIYRHTGLTIKRPVAIVGAGMTGDLTAEYAVISGAELRYTGNGNAITISGDMGAQVHRVILRDFAITSTGSGQRGIFMVNTVEECFFERLVFGGTHGNGFSVAGIHATGFSISLIDKCVFARCTTGIYLDSNPGGDSRVTIRQGNFYDNTYHIRLSSGIGIAIIENWFEKGTPIYIDNNNSASLVNLLSLKIRDNLMNNGGYAENNRFLKVVASANTLFYIQKCAITGNWIATDTNSAYAIDIDVSAVLGGNISLSDWDISDNQFRVATTAAIVSDYDLAPAFFNNEVSTLPSAYAGLHSAMAVNGKNSELVIGDAINGSLLKLLSANGTGATSNFLQVGRASGDTQAVLTICRTGTSTSVLASLVAYASQLILKSGTFVSENDIRFVSGTGPLIKGGTGSPEGVLAAPISSLWLRTDGGAGTSLYVKEGGGTGNTGWVAK